MIGPKISFAILMIALSLPLSGCGSSLELRNTGIVTGVGIDRLENGQYRLTLQLLSATSRQGQKAGTSPITIALEGTSFFEILRSMIRDSKRRLMFMHARVILMSEAAARHDVLWPLDTWTRDTQPSLKSYLMITKENVQDIPEIPTVFHDSPSFELAKGMENFAFTVKVVHINLKDFLKHLSEPPYVSYVPMLRTETWHGKGHLQFDGTALVKKNHMVGELNSRETQGLVWLIGKERGGGIDVEDPRTHRRYVLEAGKESMSSKIALRNSHLTVETTIRIPGTIAQANTANPMDPAALTNMEKLFAEEVQNIMGETLMKLRTLHVDAMGIGLKLYRQDPKAWHQVETHWDDIFSQGNFIVHVSVQAKHPGLIRSIYPRVEHYS